MREMKNTPKIEIKVKVKMLTKSNKENRGKREI